MSVISGKGALLPPSVEELEKSWLERCLPVGGFSCCARRSSTISPSLGFPYFPPRCGERGPCLLRHLGRGGIRRHGR